MGLVMSMSINSIPLSHSCLAIGVLLDFRSLTVGQSALSVHLAVGQNHLTESGQILLEASG